MSWISPSNSPSPLQVRSCRLWHAKRLRAKAIRTVHACYFDSRGPCRQYVTCMCVTSHSACHFLCICVDWKWQWVSLRHLEVGVSHRAPISVCHARVHSFKKKQKNKRLDLFMRPFISYGFLFIFIACIHKRAATNNYFPHLLVCRSFSQLIVQLFDP